MLIPTAVQSVHAVILGLGLTTLLATSAIAQVVSMPSFVTPPTQALGLGFQPQLLRLGNRILATWSDRTIGTSTYVSTDLAGTGQWMPGPNLTPHPFYEQSATVYGGGATLLGLGTVGRPLLVYRSLGRHDHLNRLVSREGVASESGWIWGEPTTVATQGLEYDSIADSPWLARDPVRGYLYLAYVLFSPGALFNSPAPNQPVMFVRSTDGGQTWSQPVLVGGPAALGSRVEVGVNGEVLVTWQDHQSKRVMLRRSLDFGATFEPEQVVAAFNDNSRVLMRGIDKGGFDGRGHPINLYEDGNVFDFVQMAVDRSNGPDRGSIYMVWAEAAEGTYAPASGRVVSETEPNDTPLTANPIEIGDTWVSFGESERFPVPPNHDLFVFQGEQGRMVAQYGQMTQYPADPNPFAQRLTNFLDLLDETTGLSPSLYRSVALKDGTAPPNLLSIPRTGRYIIPGANSGGASDLIISGLLLEYLPAPGSASRDHRDIVMVASRDGGLTWGPKVRVNDDPPGSDQALPAVAVDPSGRVHVAWLDRRDALVPGTTAAPYWTVSTNGGRSFRPSLKVGPDSDYIDFQFGGIGDFISVLPDAGGVLIAWPMIRDQWPIAAVVRVSDLPTSIAVPRFTAEPDGDAMRVAWTVSDPSGITGFVVHRATGGSEEFERLGAVEVSGAGDHAFLDRTVLTGERYRYRLEVRRAAGSTWEGPVDAMLPSGITSLQFERVGPNPFEHETRMVLAMPRRDVMDVRVYDVQGHEVRRLFAGEAPAGRHVLAWDGRDSGGRKSAPGVYHLRATGAGQRVTRSIVRIR